MAPKLPALAQSRPARTVGGRRLGQRPPHRASRDALPLAVPPAAGEQAESLAGCVDRAREAHREFVRTLREAVAGRRPLEVKAVLAHERCGLGRWLEAEGPRFAGDPALAEVALWHRRHHAAAAVVAIRAAAGRSWEAAKLLEGPTFHSTGEALLAALDALATGP